MAHGQVGYQVSDGNAVGSFGVRGGRGSFLVCAGGQDNASDAATPTVADQ